MLNLFIEASSAPNVDITDLREKLNIYPLECIFNMDVTGLFYMVLPNT